MLANEQVDASGRSWRSGAKVEKKMLRQWFFKISEFRQQLLDDLDHLATDGSWPERVLTMQRNWLGKSTGAQIKFSVTADNIHNISDIQVFTTRPDTLFGVQYLALASTHPLVQEIAKTDSKLQHILDELPSLPEDSKLGYLLPNVCATSPLVADGSTSEATKHTIPVYFAPYVLGNYGDGAVMGVPGHDARDHAFWMENNPDEPVRVVVEPPTTSTDVNNTTPYVGKGVLTSQNGSFAGLSSDEATKQILARLESEGLGSSAETWRLRDWLVSRQRYWGTPIPIIHCGSCGPVPVPESQLPVELPKGVIDWTKSNGNDLLNDPAWLHTSCPKCGGEAKRETDTMDTFVDSSWYFMRFPDSKNAEQPFSPESANACLPVDLYIGGVEHAILHLLYARFISKFLATTPLWPAGASPEILGEPFKRVLTQGMVHGKTYSDPSSGRFLMPDEVNLSNPANPVVVKTGETATITFEKMSKSKYNGVDPGTCMDKYGTDATRAHMLFLAPVSDVLEWDENKISGVVRWLNKVISHVCTLDVARRSNKEEFSPFQYFVSQAATAENSTAEMKKKWRVEQESDKKFWRSVQDTIRSVTDAYSETYSLNTVVSDLMTMSNNIIDYTAKTTKNDSSNALRYEGTSSLVYHASSALIQLMAPITPAVSEELWQILHSPQSTTSSNSIFNQPFPTPDKSYDLLAPAKRTCAVQINGKMRLAVEIPPAPEHLQGEELASWITAEILMTKEGKERLMGEGEGVDLAKGKTGRVDIRLARRVIVVRGGRTVNFVGW